MRSIVFLFSFFIIFQVSLFAQEILVVPFSTEEISSVDALIFEKFFKEELEKQIEILNKKIDQENRTLKDFSPYLDDIPPYSLIYSSKSAESEEELVKLAREADAEYVIGGSIEVIGASYIISSIIIRSSNGYVINEIRRLVAGLGELTAASGVIADTLLEEGEVMLEVYAELKEDILAEEEKPSIRDTGEVLTDRGVVFQGVFTVVGEEESLEELEIPKVELKLAPYIGMTSSFLLQSASEIIGVMSQWSFVDADMIYDEYVLSPTPGSLYSLYSKKMEFSENLFYSHFGFSLIGLGLNQAVNFLNTSYSLSPTGKILMFSGEVADAAGSIVLFLSSQNAILSRIEFFNYYTGSTGNPSAAYSMYIDHQRRQEVLFYTGLGVKGAGFGLRTAAGLFPGEGERFLPNKLFYLGGGLLSAGGTLLSWITFYEHRNAAQSYINYMAAVSPADEDYNNYEHFHEDEYLLISILTCTFWTAGAVLKGLSYYIPGPPVPEAEGDGPLVGFDIGAAGFGVHLSF